MRPAAYSLLISCGLLSLAGSSGAWAGPNIVTRATDSIAALLASGRASGQVQPAQEGLPAGESAARPANASQPLPAAESSLQAHLGVLQSQAARKLSQLNAAIASNQQPPLTNATGSAQKLGNMLEAIGNVGRAIQQQIAGANGQIQIVASPAQGIQPADLANTKKNEYQAVTLNEGQPSQPINSTNYKEQAEVLRQEIIRRASQLQQVVAGSMDVLKNNGDLIVRRLLEQMNHRLEQAKARAEKLINEPAGSEVAARALLTINQGLNNLNNIITNMVSRLDLSSKEAIQAQLSSAVSQHQQHSRSGSAPAGSSSGPLLDPNRLRQNLHQLGQQFSSAIQAAQQQRVHTRPQ